MKFDRDAWTFINSFAPWLSAIGTIAAVITSLYLASTRRARLTVHALLTEHSLDLQFVPSLPNTHAAEHFITMMITNRREREVYVEALYWNVGGLKVDQRLDLTRYTTQYSQLSAPPTLVGKQPAQLTVHAGEFVNLQLPLMASKLILSSRRVRIGARTSTGRCFETKVPKELERWLREFATHA